MVAEVLLTALPSSEDVAAMDKLMSDGKRNYVCSQPHLALDCFVELCEKLSKWYGQESEKCVDAYLLYGKTLLDIARLENGVLGHAIKEMPVFGSAEETDHQDSEKDVNTEDEEDVSLKMKPEEIRSCVQSALREENLYNESTEDDGENTEEEGDDEVLKPSMEEKPEIGGADATDEAVATTTNGESTAKPATITNPVEKPSTDAATEEPSSSSTPNTSDEKIEPAEGMEVDDGVACDGSDDDDDNDDVTNLELAWEMLELSSVILRRELAKEYADKHSINIKIAEAKYGLAQISLEAGRYQDSVNDFTECLTIYKEELEDKNGRVIAEGHYNIALAQSLDKKYDDAIEGYEMAVSILKARVVDLEEKVKAADAKESDADIMHVREWREEIAELNDLIVLDMMAKIEDAQEAKKFSAESAESENCASESTGVFDAGFSDGFGTESSSMVDVKDCTVNVRSVKRRSDEGISDGCDKKAKSSDETENTSTTE